MAAPTDAVLVSGDLLFASRLRAVLGGRSLAVVRGPDVPAAPLVFVDLNSEIDARLQLIAALRTRAGVRLVGFCNHDDRELRIRAMAEGADQVVTNGSLQDAALRLLGAAPAVAADPTDG